MLLYDLFDEIDSFFWLNCQTWGSVANHGNHNVWAEDQTYYWSAEMSTYMNDLQSQRENKSLVSVGLATNPSAGFFTLSNITATQVKDYGSQKDQTYKDDFDVASFANDQKSQPYFFTEIGGDKCTDITFHNSLWASSALGSAICGLNWEWDGPNGIFARGYENHFVGVKNFFSSINFESNDFGHRKLFHWRKANSGASFSTLIETLGTTRTSRQQSYGWIHNATSYYCNDPACTCAR